MIAFHDKTVLLTGACGAIGRAIAALFRELGADLFLTDRDATTLAAMNAGRFAACDMRDSADVGRMVKEAESFDHLVLAAGIYVPSPLTEMSDAEWHDTMAVNLNSAFYCCRSAARRINAGGSITLLSSIAGHRGSGGFSHYAASKGGLIALARSLAVELAPAVRVNAVSPGPIESPMVRPLMEKRGAQIIAQTPLGRLGKPEEVAHAVAFLASDWASFITGEAVQVNGGLYMA